MEELFKSIAEQGALFAFMGIVLWWTREDNKRLNDRMDQKSDEREKETKETIERVVKVVEQNTTAWEKVNEKLS